MYGFDHDFLLLFCRLSAIDHNIRHSVGAGPSIPCSSRINVVTSSTSWHGRVLILLSLPLKPAFFLLAPAIRLIVHDRHDKKLLVFLAFFLTVLHLIFRMFFFFCPLSAK